MSESTKGRPPDLPARPHRIEVRASEEERAIIRSGAKRKGLDLSGFVRMAALDLAKEGK